MRINQFLARASGMSRRQADTVIRQGRVYVNGHIARLGQQVGDTAHVELDGRPVHEEETATLMLNKPAGYIVSRHQQGSTPTIYALLPDHLHHLKPIGRLDKDTRGLLLLTNDGQLIHDVTHPRHTVPKIYYATLTQPLTLADLTRLNEGVYLEDGHSRLETATTDVHDVAQDHTSAIYRITMHEGRNRQIRRTFEALGYEIMDLLRTQLGDYTLSGLEEGTYQEVGPSNT